MVRIVKGDGPLRPEVAANQGQRPLSSP
jgi:hypothetical protein